MNGLEKVYKQELDKQALEKKKLFRFYTICVVDFFAETLLVTFGFFPTLFSLLDSNNLDFYRFATFSIIFGSFIMALKNGLLFTEQHKKDYFDLYNKRFDTVSKITHFSTFFGSLLFSYLVFGTGFFSFSFV